MARHPLNIALGKVVNEQRMRRGWALDDLRTATGISKSRLWNLERGRHTISLDMMLALEMAFKMVVNGLLNLARRWLRLNPRVGL